MAVKTMLTPSPSLAGGEGVTKHYAAVTLYVFLINASA